MRVAYKTEIGNTRKENQDNFRAGVIRAEFVWAVVCDGMGGANGGSVASKTVCDIVEFYFNNYFQEVFNAEKVLSFMRTVLDKANEAVYNKAVSDSSLKGMGTTAVLFVVKDKECFCAHIGDSRMYLCNNKGVVQITKDHSKIQEMIDGGEITKAEAVNHPIRNFITKAIGVSQTVTADYNTLKLNNDDSILVCTDGLSNYVSENEIYFTVNRTNFYDVPATLIKTALLNGTTDNIAVMIVNV